MNRAWFLEIVEDDGYSTEAAEEVAGYVFDDDLLPEEVYG